MSFGKTFEHESISDLKSSIMEYLVAKTGIVRKEELEDMIDRIYYDAPRNLKVKYNNVYEVVDAYKEEYLKIMSGIHNNKKEGSLLQTQPVVTPRKEASKSKNRGSDYKDIVEQVYSYLKEIAAKDVILIYDVEKQTINGKKVNREELYQTILFKCANRISCTDNVTRSIRLKADGNSDKMKVTLFSRGNEEQDAKYAKNILAMLIHDKIETAPALVDEYDASKPSAIFLNFINQLVDGEPYFKDKSTLVLSSETCTEDTTFEKLRDLYLQLPESVKQLGDLKLVLNTMQQLI